MGLEGWEGVAPCPACNGMLLGGVAGRRCGGGPATARHRSCRRRPFHSDPAVAAIGSQAVPEGGPSPLLLGPVGLLLPPTAEWRKGHSAGQRSDLERGSYVTGAVAVVTFRATPVAARRGGLSQRALVKELGGGKRPPLLSSLGFGH